MIYQGEFFVMYFTLYRTPEQKEGYVIFFDSKNLKRHERIFRYRYEISQSIKKPSKEYSKVTRNTVISRISDTRFYIDDIKNLQKLLKIKKYLEEKDKNLALSNFIKIFKPNAINSIDWIDLIKTN